MQEVGRVGKMHAAYTSVMERESRNGGAADTSFASELAALTTRKVGRNHRREQKDSNDLFQTLESVNLGLVSFDCSDYNLVGRNQHDESRDGDENKDTDSNDLNFIDVAALCLDDAAINESTKFLCTDISQSKGQLIPYEYRVYLSKHNDLYDDIISTKASDLAISTVLRDLETRIVNYVAEKIGLDGCTDNDESPVQRSLSQRAIRRRSSPQMNTISAFDKDSGRVLQNDKRGNPLIGITSEPNDVAKGQCFILICIGMYSAVVLISYS